MRIKYSHRASNDVEEIYHYGVQRFGNTQADMYHGQLCQCLELLAENPLLARERAEFTRPVRIHSWRSHAIVYVAEPDGIYIVRVLHGTRDTTHHLSGLE